jgi:hypothetical protein
MLRSPPHPLTGILWIILILNITNATEALTPYTPGDNTVFQTPQQQTKADMRTKLESNSKLADKVQKQRTTTETPPLDPPVNEGSHFWDFFWSPVETYSQIQQGKISGWQWSAHSLSKAANVAQNAHALLPCFVAAGTVAGNPVVIGEAVKNAWSPQCVHALQNVGLSLTATGLGRMSQPFTQFEQNELHFSKQQWIQYQKMLDDVVHTRLELGECEANHGSLQEVALEMQGEVEALNSSMSTCEQTTDAMRQMLASCDDTLKAEVRTCEDKLRSQLDAADSMLDEKAKKIEELKNELKQARLVNNISEWPFVASWIVRVAVELIFMAGIFVCLLLAGVLQWLFPQRRNGSSPFRWMLAFVGIVFFGVAAYANPLKVFDNRRLDFFVDLYTVCIDVYMGCLIIVVFGAFAVVFIRKVIWPVFQDLPVLQNGVQQALPAIPDAFLAELRETLNRLNQAGAEQANFSGNFVRPAIQDVPPVSALPAISRGQGRQSRFLNPGPPRRAFPNLDE